MMVLSCQASDRSKVRNGFVTNRGHVRFSMWLPIGQTLTGKDLDEIWFYTNWALISVELRSGSRISDAALDELIRLGLVDWGEKGDITGHVVLLSGYLGRSPCE